MKFLSAIDIIGDRSGKLFSYLFIVATIEVCIAVALRYFFHQPVVWGLELGVYLCGTTYIFGGAYALYRNAHIRLDVLFVRWSPRIRAIIDLVITAPFFFAFTAAVIWGSWAWAWKGMMTGEGSGTLWNPLIWPVRVVIPIGTFLLLLQGVAKFIRDLRTARRGTS